MDKKSKEKSKKKLTRREAMNRVFNLVVLAAGLSTSEATDLLARVQKLVRTKAKSKEVKMLKVLIHGSRAVFENEFGRVTPRLTVKDLVKDLKDVPPNYRAFLKYYVRLKKMLGGGFPEIDLEPDWSELVPIVPWPSYFCWLDAGKWAGEEWGVWGDVVCPGGYTCYIAGCDEAHMQGPAGQNRCQDYSCGKNYCVQFCCDGKYECKEEDNGDCSGVECPGKYTRGLQLSADIIDRYRFDPYITALFEEFNVTTAEQLVVELQKVLSIRRRGIS